MEKTKIRLSQDELELMQNSAWILTKNSVVEKLCHGLGDLSSRMQLLVHAQGTHYAPEILESTPKVSRGEKYMGLPYVMLDYPRIFGKENTLAIRTFFWWGKFCSMTLHVKGGYRAAVMAKCLKNIESLSERQLYMALTLDEWNHDLSSADYASLSLFHKEELESRLLSGVFFKLSKRIELSQWDKMEEEMFDCFVLFLDLIAP